MSKYIPTSYQDWHDKCVAHGLTIHKWSYCEVAMNESGDNLGYWENDIGDGRESDTLVPKLSWIYDNVDEMYNDLHKDPYQGGQEPECINGTCGCC